MPGTQQRSRTVNPERQHPSSRRVSRDRRGSKPESSAQELDSARMGVDYSQATFERHATLLGDARMSQPMYARQRSEIMRQLQRSYGNQYVQRLVDHIGRKRSEAVQTKLEVGPAGDRYEQEADRVAKEVVSNLPSAGQPSTQRQMPEDELQMKSIQRQMPEEDELMMKPLQRQMPEEDELMMKPIQRQMPEEDELMMKPIQRAIGAEGGAVGADMEGAIEGARGSGQPLPDSLRLPMENAFASDFSGVRVHNDTESDALNQSMSARAFTTGQDIFFKQGEYNPGSRSGQEVLAHELTHVIQQKGDEIQRVGLARIRQALGYKIGTKGSEKVLEKTFDGREFDVSNVSVVSESQLKKKYDELEGEGAYDATGGLEGFTNVNNGEIFINKDDQAVDTVPHEILHKNSNTAVGIQMGTNLDEGFTEYLTQKAVKAAGFKPSSSYPNDLEVTQKLAAIVGDGPIEKAYFDGEVAGLKTALDGKKGDGTFDKLVTAMKGDDYGAAKTALK